MIILQKILKYRTILLVIIAAVVVCSTSVSLYNYNYDRVCEKINSADEMLHFECKVKSFPESAGGDTEFIANVTDCTDKTFSGKNILVSLHGVDSDIQKSDTISFDARPYSPKPCTNEGAFDYKDYLKSLDVCCVCYPDAKSVSITKTDSVFAGVYNIRHTFIENCDKYIHKSASGLVCAILTGNRTLIDTETEDALKKAGVYHIVAVSGLHLNLFIFAIVSLVTSLKVKRRTKALVSFVLCGVVGAFVMVFTGFGISVVRAFIMMMILSWANLIPRESDTKNSLFVTGFIIIAFMPYTFYSTSWWLSFLSTLGVVEGSRLIKKLKEKGRLSFLSSNFVGQTIVISAFTALFTLPVAVTSFGHVAIYSWISNTLILPVMSIFMALGVVFCVACEVLPSLFVYIIGFVLTTMGEYITFVAKTVASIAYAYVEIYPDGVFYILSFAFVLWVVYYFCKNRLYKTTLLIMLSFSIALTSVWVYNKNDEHMQIVFADSNQGDCALVEVNGYNIMIDSGTQGKTGFVESSVEAMMRAHNIRKLDMLFVTHYHTDHMNIALSLVKQQKVCTLAVPLYYDLTETAALENRYALLEAALESNTKILYVAKGSVAYFGDDAHLEVLSPSEDMFFENNDMSLITKLTYGDTKILFCADAQDDALGMCLDKDLDCDIIKIPHHGGYNELTDALIEKSSPEIAVISCGQNNYYNHPDQRVLDILRKNKCNTYRTDKNGAVIIKADKSGNFETRTMR